MKYVWKIFLIVVAWPLIIAICVFGITAVNLLRFLWYFNFNHFEWIPNFWFPINTDGKEMVFTNSAEKDFAHKWVRYEEYYKTPLDLFLNKRHRIYPNDNS